MNYIKELKEVAIDKKLLIVEDELELNSELADLFDIFFTDVDTSFDGENGLQKILENDYDVVLSDIDMPILNGISMIEKAKTKKENLSFIILSGRLGEHSDDFEKLNIKYTCDKPYDLDLLFSQLIEILGSKSIN